MKRETMTNRSALSIALVTGLIVAAVGFMAPQDAAAGVRVRASIDTPLRATVVIGDGPRLCSIPKPVERRTVVVRDCDRCGCDGHRYVTVKGKHHRRDRHHKVWVPGHWEQTSRRTARWIPGHWERI